MKKVFQTLLFSFLAFFILNVSVSAEERESRLSLLEEHYLINIAGYTAEEISLLPVEVAKELVKSNAQPVDSELVNLNSTPDDLMESYGVISATSLSIQTPKVSKVTSDMAGHKKFLITTGFDWKSQPTFTLTDKLAIGFPSSLGAVFPAKSGNIQQHFSRYYMKNPSTNKIIYSPLKTTTQDWDPSGGVGAAYNLSSQVPVQNLRHGGLIGQYFYISNAKTGSANVKIEYGHRRGTGSVSLGMSASGLGVTPSINTDTRNYALLFKY